MANKTANNRGSMTSSVHFQAKILDMLNDLESRLDESRSRIIARAVTYLHQKMIKEGKEDYRVL